MTDAHLIYLSIEDGFVDTHYRVLINADAYAFVEFGGAIPDTVAVDAALHFDITYIESKLAIAKTTACYSDEYDPILRAMLITPSAFDGMICNADDINALIQFATAHDLTLQEHRYYAHEDIYDCLDWGAMRDDHLGRILRGIQR